MLRSGPTDILRFYNSISTGKTYLGQGWRGALQQEYRVNKEKADTHEDGVGNGDLHGRAGS